jgi:hypothetical protein
LVLVVQEIEIYPPMTVSYLQLAAKAV